MATLELITDAQAELVCSGGDDNSPKIKFKFPKLRRFRNPVIVIGDDNRVL